MERIPLATVSNAVVRKRKRAPSLEPATGRENISPDALATLSSLDTDVILADEVANCTSVGEGEGDASLELALDHADSPSNIRWDAEELRKQIISSLSSADRASIQAFMAQARSVDRKQLQLSSLKEQDTRHMSEPSLESANKALSYSIGSQKHEESQTKLHEAFDAFSKREVAISQRPLGHLVQPSGLLSASLGIKLHYPTFSGKGLKLGEVAN